MEKIVSTKELRNNFLELCSDLATNDSKALLDLEDTDKIRNIIEMYCTEKFPFNHVLLMFHRYACIAFISAEFVVNAKVYIDNIKEKYIILALVKKNDPDEVSVVYSNVEPLSRFPTRSIAIKEIIFYLESDDIESTLLEFYKKRKTFY